MKLAFLLVFGTITIYLLLMIVVCLIVKYDDRKDWTEDETLRPADDNENQAFPEDKG